LPGFCGLQIGDVDGVEHRAATEQAVIAAVAETGASTIKDMGRVMAALKAKYAATLDMAKVGPLVKARLGG